MTEETMPAAEVSVVVADQNSYELAFHVLPTVAEGEVSDVFTDIKTIITDHGGAIFDEEAPQRIELAYDIIQNTEGKNRNFTSAYFGWVRATVPSEAVAAVTEAMDHNEQVLRHLLIKLTKLEVENPVRFHELMAELDTKITTIEEGEVSAPVTAEAPAEAATPDEAAAEAPAEAVTSDEAVTEETTPEATLTDAATDTSVPDEATTNTKLDTDRN